MRDLRSRVLWAVLIGVVIITGVVAFDLAASAAEAARGYVCGNAACTIAVPIGG